MIASALDRSETRPVSGRVSRRHGNVTKRRSIDKQDTLDDDRPSIVSYLGCRCCLVGEMRLIHRDHLTSPLHSLSTPLAMTTNEQQLHQQQQQKRKRTVSTSGQPSPSIASPTPLSKRMNGGTMMQQDGMAPCDDFRQKVDGKSCAFWVNVHDGAQRTDVVWK